MNKIEFNDIDFSVLKKMNYQGSKSIIYEDENFCYKILDGLYPSELDTLEKKLIDMHGIKINNAYMPVDLIVDGNKLVGFTLNKFKNSMTIYDKFSGQFVDFKELFGYITSACQILRELHKNGILCQDLSFDNILVDTSGNVAFCDLDGCAYNGYESPFISMPMKKLICDYRKDYFVNCENFDRISMLVSLYYLIYNKYLYKIPKINFEILSRDVKTINNSMIYVSNLLDKSKNIPEVPYLDELIEYADDFIMDRKKEFGLLRRTLKK